MTKPRRHVVCRIISAHVWRGQQTLHLECPIEVSVGQVGHIVRERPVAGGEVRVLRTAGRYAIVTTELPLHLGCCREVWIYLARSGGLDRIMLRQRSRQTLRRGSAPVGCALLATRRAYGFHSAAAAIAMIMLCCTGLDLQPVTKWLSS